MIGDRSYIVAVREMLALELDLIVGCSHCKMRDRDRQKKEGILG